MSKIRSQLAASVAVSALLASAAASATVVTFDTLGGTNGDLFTSYAESGYTVTKLSGSGCVAAAVGNPPRSVFGGPVCDNGSIGVFSVTGSGLFNFNSVDMLAQNGDTSYTITGLIGASTIWTQTGTWTGNSIFGTLPASNSGPIDQLVFNLRAAGTSFNFDNINVSAGGEVPEPGSFALAGLALCGLAASRRRKTAERH
jgi:MYXO-CTERM domain-containing protein